MVVLEDLQIVCITEKKQNGGGDVWSGFLVLHSFGEGGSLI